MVKLAFKQFIRSGATIIGLSFILLSGVLSVFIGKQFLRQQEEAAKNAGVFQKEYTANYVNFFKDDLGLLLYYLKFSLVNTSEPLAGISIGQRDVNISIQSVTIRNLENQKWDTDLNNPANLLLGNMDLGFVMIYLFPLLIIAFTFNLLSEEKEGGTWRMIQFQSPAPLRTIWNKLVVRVGLIYIATAFLLLLAVVILSIPLNKSLLATVLLFACYHLFWFTLCLWVVSWRKSSAFNAVALSTLWVVLIILSPAIVNSYISNGYPVPEALHMVVKQRQGYHEKWDMEKSITMNKFYSHYPQFKKYPLPDKQFSWLWYYAMHQMGDDESFKQSTELREKLRLRENKTRTIALFLPVLHTQLALNSLSQTDLKNHLLFLDSTQAFHEKKRLFFYERIFANRPVNSVDWSSIKVEKLEVKQEFSLLKMLLPLIIVCFVLGWISRNGFKKLDLHDPS